MPVVVLFIIFVLLLVIAVPVSITLGITSVLPSICDPSFTVGAKYLIRAMFGGLDSFPLLAVPMFVLSGIIMAKGGISKKLFDVFAYFLGKFTAGMPCAVIVTCLFYGAISGSAPATVAAVGSMTIPILTNLGYDLTFSTAIVAVAGGLGVIIPPSIPFIMYGMASGASVSDLFLAGIVPGLMIGALLMIYAIYHCKRYGEDKAKIHAEVQELHDKGLLKVLRKLLSSLEPGHHPWMYLQRCRFSDRSRCYLCILCTDHQPFCIQEHPYLRYLGNPGGSDPYFHPNPLHPGCFHCILQSPDSDAGSTDSQ